MTILLKGVCFLLLPLAIIGAILCAPFEWAFNRLEAIELAKKLELKKFARCHTGDHLLSECPGDHGK